MNPSFDIPPDEEPGVRKALSLVWLARVEGKKGGCGKAVKIYPKG